MGRLIEEPLLRDRVQVFRDRKEAGRLLGQKLSPYGGTDSCVFAIPAGGVPVGKEVSRILDLPFDLIVVRKIQIPYNPEAGFGAVTPDGEAILNEELLSHLHLSEEQVEEAISRTKEKVKEREALFRKGRPFPDLGGRTVILVDDGLASGYTMLAAVLFVQRKGAGKVVIAVPTASDRAIETLLPRVDEIYCLNLRGGPVFAVADAYERWYDISDQEVLSLIEE